MKENKVDKIMGPVCRSDHRCVSPGDFMHVKQSNEVFGYTIKRVLQITRDCRTQSSVWVRGEQP